MVFSSKGQYVANQGSSLDDARPDSASALFRQRKTSPLMHAVRARVQKYVKAKRYEGRNEENAKEC